MVVRSSAIVITIAIALAPHARAEVSPSTDGPEVPANKNTSKPAPKTSPRSKAKNPPLVSARPADKPKTERATFGAGCFWHVEDVFERLKGVNWAVSGYAGGDIPYPSYEMVHEGTTGHAEVVMVDYDPDVISYDDLLKVFWKNHDPTSLNRQGPDVGPQYRSVIFYHNEDQRKAAYKSYQALTELGAYRSPIVTQLVPLRAFYKAEDYHQDYYGGKPRATSRRRKTKTANAKVDTRATKKQAADDKEPPETKSVPDEKPPSVTGPDS